MARIVIRILLSAVLIGGLIIAILSYVTNTNIIKKYGVQIMKFVGIFALLIIAFYVALGLMGVS